MMPNLMRAHASKFAKLAVSYVAEMAKNAGDVVTEPTNQLENGVAKTGLAGAAKEQLFFTLEVPAMSSNLEFVTEGGSGDADLYVKFAVSRPYRTLIVKAQPLQVMKAV